MCYTSVTPENHNSRVQPAQAGTAGRGAVPVFQAVHAREDDMTESVYKVVELVGSSPESWEKAATAAIAKAGSNLRDLRVATVAEQDMKIEEGRITAYRVRLKLSFKIEGGD